MEKKYKLSGVCLPLLELYGITVYFIGLMDSSKIFYRPNQCLALSSSP